MKQVLTRGLKLSLLVALVVSLSLAANYFLLAWVAPTANPPADNITIEGVPPNSVMAFYRADCPAGWKAADGTNSTPDLRGQFIRALTAMKTRTALERWVICSRMSLNNMTIQCPTLRLVLQPPQELMILETLEVILGLYRQQV